MKTKMCLNIGISLKINSNFTNAEILINICILELDIIKMDYVFLVVLNKIHY